MPKSFVAVVRVAALCFLLCCSLSAFGATPAITLLNPSAIPTGSASQTVTVVGTGFVAGSTATLDGASRPLTVVSATQAKLMLVASDFATYANKPIVITTPVGVSSAPAYLRIGVPLAMTPPMGWNSLYAYYSSVSEKNVKDQVDAIVHSGLRELGYTIVDIDEGWEGERDSNGVLHSNSKFPNMKALGDYIHHHGLKFGIYTSIGTKTCSGYEGSRYYEEQDAALFLSWGVDYLRYDSCTFTGTTDDLKATTLKMSTALRKGNSNVILSLIYLDKAWTYAPGLGVNLWRIYLDTDDIWNNNGISLGFSEAGLEQYAGPGHWNDPDLLHVGGGRMNTDEYKTQMNLWSMLAAPLIMSLDLTKATPTTLQILGNRDVIAVDQDALGVQGHPAIVNGTTEIWVRPLANGDTAVAVFNRADIGADATVDWNALGLGASLKVRDLWTGKNVGSTASPYSIALPMHGSVLLRISK